MRLQGRVASCARQPAERERLRQYAEKLGLDLSEDTKARSPRRRAESTARKRATTRKPAATKPRRAVVKARGNDAPSRADQLAELVRRKPGMSVRQAADELGIKDPTSLYRPLRRLEAAGELRRSKGKREPIK